MYLGIGIYICIWTHQVIYHKSDSYYIFAHQVNKYYHLISFYIRKMDEIARYNGKNVHSNRC